MMSLPSRKPGPLENFFTSSPWYWPLMAILAAIGGGMLWWIVTTPHA